jgi:hypothetical protein
MSRENSFDGSDQRHSRIGPGAELIAYFSEVATTGRGNCIDDLVYIEINKSERRMYPQLAECYGVAIQLPTGEGEKARCFVFETEAEFDDDVLAALSRMACGSEPWVQ